MSSLTSSALPTLLRPLEKVVEELLKGVPESAHSITVGICAEGLCNLKGSSIEVNGKKLPVMFVELSQLDKAGEAYLIYETEKTESMGSRLRREEVVEVLLDILD